MFAKIGFVSALAVLYLCLPVSADEIRNPLKDGETWQELRGDVFEEREIKDATGVFTLDAYHRTANADC